MRANQFLILVLKSCHTVQKLLLTVVIDSIVLKLLYKSC